MSAACTYCGGAEWEVDDRTVVCRQCGLSPAQAQAKDREYREAAPLHRPDAEPAVSAEDRTAELRRRSDLVVAMTEGMSVPERMPATTALLVVGMRLPAAMWDERFAEWKRDVQAAARSLAS